MNKGLIRKNFSRCARYYDRYSSIQNLCALGLLRQIKTRSLSRILDIGCGTGNYTKLLRQKFPFAQINALDISPEMVKVAKEKLQDERIEFMVADGEVIDFAEQFDLITSNACFQWFEDLDAALGRYRDLVRENGYLLFSTFGPFTFYELNISLKELFKKDSLIASCNFPSKDNLSGILQRHFKDTIIVEEVFTEEHNSILELLNKIRYTGVRGNGVNGRVLWTNKVISELEREYKKGFRNLKATYQIFYCRAVK